MKLGETSEAGKATGQAWRVHAAMYRVASMAAQGKGPGAVEWWLEKASQTLGHSVARPNPCEPIEKASRFVRVQCAVCSGEKKFSAVS